MSSRLVIIVITTFFIAMNALLWHWEIAARNDLGSPVPVRSVLEKILTAPDFSSMEVQHHGRKIGHCRLVPAIDEAQEVGRQMSEDRPEGMIRRPLHYTLDLNGTILVGQNERLRFSFDLRLSTNHAWEQFTLRMSLRPTDWTIRSSAADRELHFVVDDGGVHTQRVFHFEELRNPQKLLGELGGPLVSATLASFGLNLPSADAPRQVSLGLKWEAHQDRLAVGNARIRGYRLRARLFDRYQIVLFVSPVGEILRVELPDNVVLRNESLNSLYNLHD